MKEFEFFTPSFSVVYYGRTMGEALSKFYKTHGVGVQLLGCIELAELKEVYKGAFQAFTGSYKHDPAGLVRFLANLVKSLPDDF